LIASKLVDQLTILNVDQVWCIVENLLNSQMELADPGALKVTESVLDALAPNWREAKNCALVRVNPVLTLNIVFKSCLHSEDCSIDRDRPFDENYCTVCLTKGVIERYTHFAGEMTELLSELQERDSSLEVPA